VDFVDDDLSLLHVSFISSVRFSLRLVSGVKRFEDMMGCSVFIEVTVGVFAFLLKLRTLETIYHQLVNIHSIHRIETASGRWKHRGQLPC
jgi:hypothetical protein